eukprot:gene4127-62_t
MLSNIIKEHTEAKAQRTSGNAAETRIRASEQMQALVSDAVVDLNAEVSQVFANQKAIDSEIQSMQEALARQKRATAKWSTSVKKFNQSLKEIGDVENWTEILENDMRIVLDAIQLSKQGETFTETETS